MQAALLTTNEGRLPVPAFLGENVLSATPR
jgi:hypothetical protein